MVVYQACSRKTFKTSFVLNHRVLHGRSYKDGTKVEVDSTSQSRARPASLQLPT